MAGATVIVQHLATGLTVTRASDAGDRYFVPALSVGAHTITITLHGVKTATLSLVLSVGQRLEVQIELAIAIGVKAVF